jgi:hypothetical protein
MAPTLSKLQAAPRSPTSTRNPQHRRVGDDQGISREEVNLRVMSMGASNAAVARADNAAKVKKGARVEDIHEVQEVNGKDALRERNLGAYLPLPQLVAVGDQSSGKSSLLESLTGIAFPRGQGLCTRYATQITHRREAHQRIDMNIIPGPHALQDHKRKLELYRR